MGFESVNVDQMASEVSARHEQSAQPSTESAPSNNQQSATPQGNNSDVMDLNSVLKFKFGEREWTPDQLQKAIMLQSDYTKKTQALSERTKYYDNLQYDLDTVRKNPSLAAEFMKTYPKEFHKYLNSIGIQNEAPQAQQTHAPIDPQFIDRFQRLEEFVTESQVKAHEAQLDAKFSALSKKYPEASEDIVLARAQALIDKGEPVTDETWDRLWKQSHEHFVKKFEDKQKQTLQTQRTANQSYRGPTSGGGVPTQAPKKETFKEATERAVRELQGRKF